MPIYSATLRPTLPATIGATAGASLPWEGGGGAPAAMTVAIDAFAAGAYYLSSANVLVPTAAGGFGFGIALRVDSVPAAAAAYVAMCGRAVATRGFGINNHTTGVLRFTCINGAGTAVHTPTLALVAGDVGKVITLVGLYDGTTLRLYRGGAEVGSGTAITGYLAPDATDKTAIGTNPFAPSGAIDWAAVVGLCAWTGAPDATAVAAWHAAVKAARTVTDMGGAGVTPTARWRAADPSPASWVDQVGGLALAKVGTPVSVTFAAVWE